MDFAILADHRVKIKESEKINKFLDLARKLEKQWNMRVTVMPIRIGSLRIVHKILKKRLEELEIRGRTETIKTTALLRLAGILRKVLETCCHLDSCEKAPVKTDVKNLQGVEQ